MGWGGALSRALSRRSAGAQQALNRRSVSAQQGAQQALSRRSTSAHQGAPRRCPPPRPTPPLYPPTVGPSTASQHAQVLNRRSYVRSISAQQGAQQAVNTLPTAPPRRTAPHPAPPHSTPPSPTVSPSTALRHAEHAASTCFVVGSREGSFLVLEGDPNPFKFHYKKGKLLIKMSRAKGTPLEGPKNQMNEGGGVDLRLFFNSECCFFLKNM